jgi:hypothetical protein
MVNCFYQVVLIPWQSYHYAKACSLGLAISGGDGMDSLLEYKMTGVCGFVLLHPFMPYVRLTLPET